MIILNHSGLQTIIKPTIFPDGTQQVWKLELLKSNNCNIVWKYENDGELITLAQLIDLLKNEGIQITGIFIPFLPYARQDKLISNTTTFGLNTFCRMLNQITGNINVYSLDIHNNAYGSVENIEPTEYILKAIIESEASRICFPDKGAFRRYHSVVPDNKGIITLNKMRNQETGEIVEMSLISNDKALINGGVLIVDDICDGGATFINTVKSLRSNSIFQGCNIDLYTTHGIYSKGINNLIDNGINKLYTTDSFCKLEENKRLKIFQTRFK